MSRSTGGVFRGVGAFTVCSGVCGSTGAAGAAFAAFGTAAGGRAFTSTFLNWRLHIIPERRISSII